MTDELSLFRRRQFLLESVAAVSSASLLGCSRTKQANLPASSSERSDVPLRLLLFGTSEDAETIRRGWGAVTDQPLDVKAVALDRSTVETLEKELTEGARKADVMIYPLLLVGTASQNQLVVEISDDALTTIDSE
ncbi:MAG: hypothetical protein ACR2NZ_03460, partial [Rubripirellula sp.]